MRLLFCCSCLLVLGSCTGNLLNKTLDALENGLGYLSKKLDKINLDAVFCVRLTQEQLQSFLDNEPEVFEGFLPRVQKLRDLAKQTADEAIPYVKAQNPKYYKDVGLLVQEKKAFPWYPSKETPEEYAVEALSCSEYYYDWRTENDCYHALSGGDGKVCQVSLSCIVFNVQFQQRLYGLTHQVLFWQQLQSFGCVESVSVELQQRLCSNVMRDAEHLAKAKFPENSRDVFIEQVAFCGMWGFRDFNQPHWLQNILEWQQDSGCYTEHAEENCFDEIPEESRRRVKRSELRIDDGCYSHTTGISTIAVNLRFEAEKLYLINQQKKSKKYNL